MTTPWAQVAAPAVAPGHNLTTRSIPNEAAEAIGQGGQRKHVDLEIDNDSSPDQVAAMIVQYAQDRDYSDKEGIAVLATGLLSGLKPTAKSNDGLRPVAKVEDGKYYKYHGIFLQDESYERRSNPNEQIHEFFERLDSKRRDQLASTDIYRNIFWMRHDRSARSADVAYNKHPEAYRKFLTAVKSKLREAEQLYKKYYKERQKVPWWEPRPEKRRTPPRERGPREENDDEVRLLRPPGASERVLTEIDRAEEALKAARDPLRANNPTRAPERDPGPDVASVHADGETVGQYRMARPALRETLSDLRDQNRRVDSLTDAVPTAVDAARRQVNRVARKLNGHLQTYELAIRVSGYAQQGATVETPVVNALGQAGTRVDEILVDATLAQRNLAAGIGQQTAATTLG